MAKCELCNEKKARRECPALSKKICTFCCATKREKEIECTSDCEHLSTGKDFKKKKNIEKLVRAAFVELNEDVFKSNPDILTLISEFEKILAVKYYENNDVNDNTIYNALSKVFAEKETKFEIKFDSEYEKEIIEKYYDLEKKYSDLDDSLKKVTVVKLLDTIKKETGGTYCDRAYLREVHIKNGGKVYF